MERKGNYLIEPVEEIGNGTFGKVELINLFNLNGKLAGQYARKTLSVQKEYVGSIFTHDELRRRFKREVFYQANCKHSNIVYICMHHMEIDNPWFIMELSQTDLRKELSENILDINKKVEITKMILKGVIYVHQKGYLHRDLKPANILKFNNDVYKVSDFGLIKNSNNESESEILTKIQIALGTVEYMSPEAKRGEYSIQSDIYALGVIMEEMDISAIGGVDDIIRKSTNLRCKDRYQSVSEMLVGFNKVIERREQ
ncbi:serine/threonine protein kinase [Arsenophonus sp. ENCA]|uniref:serine/threonine-protein kinase n=1 Tax=Arsenophonus sp. ENCA TaxID=1987579 RepID=UPI000BC9A857|nr:serine/threonine-protein kinase [Arsenophonus sp. ENCA]PAV02167.1 serine/threonine protein kinase [Arsenophonus sp. ENCA]